MSDLRAADALVAKHVIGWKDIHTSPFNGEMIGLPPGVSRPRTGSSANHQRIPNFNTSIEDALSLGGVMERKSLTQAYACALMRELGLRGGMPMSGANAFKLAQASPRARSAAALVAVGMPIPSQRGS